MSLIHWDKSVLSFHLKEIIEDGRGNHPLALAGLSAIAIGSFVVPAVTKLGKPVLKAAIKNSLSFERTSVALPANASTSELMKIWEDAALSARNTGQLATENAPLQANSKQLTN
ncbi:hypothetical protein [Oscillatoria salina]|uniref:hypothetical protein n=1 Tax=Oscillatoria salina TaxID=331517 RepID=UPI001CCC7464|nr:hypothetical protein [Oscillatoria salina]